MSQLEEGAQAPPLGTWASVPLDEPEGMAVSAGIAQGNVGHGTERPCGACIFRPFWMTKMKKCNTMKDRSGTAVTSTTGLTTLWKP